MQPYTFFILFTILSSPAGATENSDDCHLAPGRCSDKSLALHLKIIAIFAILVTSTIGISLPLFSRSLPALQPDRNPFTIAKAFAGGVILATGYMHVLPDSFELLNSKCLPEDPWRKFPFTTFVAMLSAVGTLMVDSLSTSFYQKINSGHRCLPDPANLISDAEIGGGSGGCSKDAKKNQLIRHRIISQVLELGIVVHSVVIGLSLGTSQNPCTIKPLVAALCFHQLFEGMGLGGCILQAEYTKKARAIMVFFFSVTTPLGIAMGIGLSKAYKQNSSTALIVVGILNASSAGLLNYMALVDILAEDFMGPKLQNSPKLQLQAYLAVLLGAGGMSLMAKWA